MPGHLLAAEVVPVAGGVAVRVADNGEFCTAAPAPPAARLLPLPVHESIRCVPRPERLEPAPPL